MMAALKIGYVGCGFLAQTVHLPNIMELESCELVALAERYRPRLGEAVRAKLGVPRLYPNHTDLIADPEVEAVAVSAHYAAQGEIARDALEAGKPVFMEKPMAVSLAQAESILAAERRGGGRLMVGYMKRYDAGNELFRRLVAELRESGELGPVVYARNHGFCGDWLAGRRRRPLTTDEPRPTGPDLAPDWLPEAYRARYLGYLQQYTHNVNLLRWVLGADDVAVRRVDLDEDGMTGVVVLGMAGVRAVIESALTAHHAWDEHTQVFFKRGWVRADSPPLMLDGARARVTLYRDGRTEERLPAPEEGRWSWSFRREVAHFAESVLAGTPFRSPGTDALHDVRALEEIYRAYVAAREGA